MPGHRDQILRLATDGREASTTDRRVKHVVLTSAGLKIYEKVKTEAVALRKHLLANVDQKKLLIATELLEGLQGVIEQQP